MELSNASKEAVALGRLPKGAGNVVADVVQQVSVCYVCVFVCEWVGEVDLSITSHHAFQAPIHTST